MIGQADRRIVMADHSKFGIRAPDFVSGWKGFCELITDTEAPRADVARLERMGIQVTRVSVRRRA
jgi:DeoR/GlpR family transcriptional regulator of sugar metabolism